jgi:hypothetical protein
MSFSEECISEVQSMLFDYQRCERADGTFYGTGGACRKGSPVNAKEQEKEKTKTMIKDFPEVKKYLRNRGYILRPTRDSNKFMVRKPKGTSEKPHTVEELTALAKRIKAAKNNAAVGYFAWLYGGYR